MGLHEIVLADFIGFDRLILWISFDYQKIPMGFDGLGIEQNLTARQDLLRDE